MHKRTLSLLPSLLLAACGGPPTDGDPQAQALAALEAETNTTWTVRYHADVHTPAFLEGRTAPMVAKPSDAARASLTFLRDHRALFLLGSPDDELAHVATDTDELGMSHARFQQRVGGVPVWGGELTAHFAADGALVRVHGRYLPLPAIDAAPVATVEEALAAASAAALAARPAADPATVSAAPPQLVVDPERGADQPLRLAWRVEVRVADPAAPARLGVFVDARTGQAYRSEELLDQLAGSGDGVTGDHQALVIAESNGHYSLTDGDDASPAQRTYSAGGAARLPGHLVTSDRPDRWDTGAPGRGAAVDAHAFVTATHRYFATAHGRKGWDGQGRGMRATVHYGNGFANAFWDGAQLVFGDGDGAHFIALSGALDVVAHEFTHAVTESSARLGHTDEPGALNEAISDVFGCFVEHAVRGNHANWTVGEAVAVGFAHGIRDLKDPHLTGSPAHAS